MTAVNLPWTQINRKGSNTPAAEVNGDPVNGHVAANDGMVEIVVRNADAGAAHNVTFAFAASAAVDGVQPAPWSVSVPASSTRKFFGFPTAIYGTAISITVDSTQLKLSAEHKAGVS